MNLIFILKKIFFLLVIRVKYFTQQFSKRKKNAQSALCYYRLQL